jgi:hypothetical protein
MHSGDRNRKLAMASCAYCDCRNHPLPLHDSKLALTRPESPFSKMLKVLAHEATQLFAQFFRSALALTALRV